MENRLKRTLVKMLSSSRLLRLVCALLFCGCALVWAEYIPKVPKECTIIVHGKTVNTLMIHNGKYLTHRPVFQEVTEDGQFGSAVLFVSGTEFAWVLYKDENTWLGTSDGLATGDSATSCPEEWTQVKHGGYVSHNFQRATPTSMCQPTVKAMNGVGDMHRYDGLNYRECVLKAYEKYPASVVVQHYSPKSVCEIKMGNAEDYWDVADGHYRCCERTREVKMPGLGEPQGGYTTGGVFGVCVRVAGTIFDYDQYTVAGIFNSFEECAVHIAEVYPSYPCAQWRKSNGECWAKKGLFSKQRAGSDYDSCKMTICNSKAVVFEGGTTERMHDTDNFDDCSKLVSGMRIDAVGAQWGKSGEVAKQCFALFGDAAEVASTEWESCTLPTFCAQGTVYYSPPSVAGYTPHEAVLFDGASAPVFSDCAQQVGQGFPTATVVERRDQRCEAHFNHTLSSVNSGYVASCRINIVRHRAPLKYEDRTWKETDMGDVLDFDACLAKVRANSPESMGMAYRASPSKCVAIPLMAYVDATSHELQKDWMSAFLEVKRMGTTTSTTSTTTTTTSTVTSTTTATSTTTSTRSWATTAEATAPRPSSSSTKDASTTEEESSNTIFYVASAGAGLIILGGSGGFYVWRKKNREPDDPDEDDADEDDEDLASPDGNYQDHLHYPQHHSNQYAGYQTQAPGGWGQGY